MIGIGIGIAIAVTMVTSWPTMASDYCLPTQDGKPRIEKQAGRLCPSEYHPVEGGRCCEALHPDAPIATPKQGGRACPSGTFTSGGYCLGFR